MKPFLYYVAKDLIGRYGNNLSDVTIVFPGRRAQLYMNYFLSYFAQGPVWAPRFKTIDELFQQFSPYTPSDNILNVCRLYRIYAELAPHPETLDNFFSWGEILMNDFGDIDKHLADADKLFANTADLMALERTDYLNDSQIQALREFFANFDPKEQSEIKQRFLEMWQIMPQMYHRLKADLKKDGMLYKGALYREVAESLSSSPLPSNTSATYAFVGFNVLDEVEEQLFQALHDAGQALFYWDYDLYYASKQSTHEAGVFIRHNIQRSPSALSKDIYNNLTQPGKKIQVLASSTDNAQAHYLSQWIEGKPEKGSAIVLCDEALMRPVLHALPDTASVNITMGYPLTDTAIYGYLSALIDLQVDGYNADLGRFRTTAMERVEKNSFFTTFPEEMRPLEYKSTPLLLVDWLIEAVEALGKSLSEVASPSPYDQLYAESTFQMYKMLGQFRWLITEGTLDVSTSTLRRLIRQAMQMTSIPFHGEMDEGIQIMGLLEARSLDFTHLIMLSVGEGIIPRKASEVSLIPYILRAHFGLDTLERQDAVYAYSFYRLLQRSEDITLVYNENSTGATQREQSRFIRQLIVESGLDIQQLKLDAPFSIAPPVSITVEKDQRVMDILRHKKSLSPTAINQYIECRLKFYFQQIAHLRMPERPQDGIDAAIFGTIFHDTCEHFYRSLCEKTGRKQVLHSDLEPVIQTPALLIPHIDAAFGDIPSISGVNMIIRDVIIRLVIQLLKWDMEHTPFTIYGMEVDEYATVTIPAGNQDINLTIGGRIDRMDIMHVNGQPTLRVVDYKTGKEKPAPSSIEGIFDASGHNAHGYYLQTFLYSLIMSQKQQLPVSPALFYILSATNAQDYDPILKLGKENTVTDIKDYAQEYWEGLERVLTEIFSSEIPFDQTTDLKRCEYCDFRRLCNR